MHKGAIIVLLALFSSACTQKMICPAYQSSFIHDKEALRKKFSYFKEDSTPKLFATRKTKYLVAVPESYRKKLRNLRTIEMKPVYPVIPDSLKVEKEADLLLDDLDVVDSTAASADTVEADYAITKTKEKYNLDQDLYMWYFRKVLVMPDVRAAMEAKENEEKSDRPLKTSRSKKRGLFRKKDKADSLQDEMLPPDSTASSKKRSLFGGRKKEKVPADAGVKPKQKEPAKKEDEDDDGF